MNTNNMTIKDVFEAGLFNSFFKTQPTLEETKTYKGVNYTVEVQNASLKPYSCNCSSFKTEKEVIAWIEEVFFA